LVTREVKVVLPAKPLRPREGKHTKQQSYNQR
jgi:hypothetical protein